MVGVFSLVARIVALAITYYVVGRIGLLLAVPPGYATIIWPPSGIAVGALVLWGSRVWPGVAFGSFILSMAVAAGAGSPASLSATRWWIALAIAAGSTLQALGIRALIHGAFGRPLSLGGWRDVIRLLVLAGPCGCVIAASVGTAAMWFGNLTDTVSTGHNWFTWWAGDALGVVIFMPIVLLAGPKAGSLRWRGGEVAQLSASALLVLLVPLGLTFYSWDLAVHFIYERNATRFAALAQENEKALQHRIDSYEQALRGAAGFFQGSNEVSAEEWRYFVDELDLHRNLPGMIGLGWISDVPAAQLDRFVETVRSQGRAEFTIHPQGGEEDFIITYVEPHDRNIEAYGLNIAVEENRRHAAIVARDTGKPAITNHIQLVQEHSQREGFLLLLPVYAAGMPTGTVEQRRAALRGWVYAPLLGQTLMAGLTNAQGYLFDLTVYDNNQSDAMKIYATHDRSDVHPSTFAVNKSLTIGQQHWTIRWNSTPAFEREIASYEPTLILGAGLMLSAAFGAFALVMTRREQRVQELVERRTAQLQMSEAALRSSEETFRSAMEHAPAGMALVDAAGRWIQTNQSLSRMLGYSSAELHAMKFQDVTHPDDLPNDLEHLHRALRGELESYQIEKRYLRKDGGTVWVQLNVSLIRNPDGSPRYFIGQVQDITQRREIDRLKSEFISTVSHELRTPLTSIRGSLGLLVGGALGALPEKAGAMVRIAHANSERLIAIINDILDIEKIEAGRIELHLVAVAVGDFLRESLSSNQAYGSRYRVSFQLEEVDPVLRVRADPDRLAQVMANLLSNAAKFSEAGDVVRIRASAVGASVVFEVEDQGIGIPDEFKPRVFEKFAQADSSSSRRFEGTGLGLSITKQLIEAMHGSISFRSALGHGTTFRIELPLASEGEDAPQLSTASTAHAPAGAQAALPRILHVEDDPDFSSIIAAAISGYAEILRVHSVSAARDALRHGRYSLLLLDPGLPQESGFDLFQDLERDNSNMPVIVLSASEVSVESSADIRAVLVKSRTSEARIVEIILSVLGKSVEL
jgi:PAS domain S-box-containing protein